MLFSSDVAGITRRCSSLVRLLLPNRRFCLYDGETKANARLAELLSEMGMVRSDNAALAISCHIQRGKIVHHESPCASTFKTLNKPGAVSITVDVYTHWHRVKTVQAVTVVGEGQDQTDLLMDRIKVRLAWALFWADWPRLR